MGGTSSVEQVLVGDMLQVKEAGGSLARRRRPRETRALQKQWMEVVECNSRRAIGSQLSRIRIIIATFSTSQSVHLQHAFENELLHLT